MLKNCFLFRFHVQHTHDCFHVHTHLRCRMSTAFSSSPSATTTPTPPTTRDASKSPRSAAPETCVAFRRLADPCCAVPHDSRGCCRRCTKTDKFHGSPIVSNSSCGLYMNQRAVRSITCVKSVSIPLFGMCFVVA